MNRGTGVARADVLFLLPARGGKGFCHQSVRRQLEVFCGRPYREQEVPFSSRFAESFYQNGCWILSNAFLVCREYLLFVCWLVLVG